MKHQRWVKLIYLYGDGELSWAEQTALDHHLTHCAACKALQQEVFANRKSLLAEMNGPLSFPDPNVMADGIMGVVNKGDCMVSNEYLTVSKGFLGFFLMPGTRVALQVSTLLLLAVFLFEHLQLTTSIKRLEIQLQMKQSELSYARVGVFPTSIREVIVDQLKQRGAQYSFSRGEASVFQFPRNTLSRQFKEVRMQFPRLSLQELHALLNAEKEASLTKNWRKP